jgi:hypothetical protein
MANPGLKYIEVARVANEFLEIKNIIPTVEAIRSALDTTASTTTLVKHLNKWKEERMFMSLNSSATSLSFSSSRIAEHLAGLWNVFNESKVEQIEYDIKRKEDVIMHMENLLKAQQGELHIVRQENESLHKCRDEMDELKQELDRTKEKLAQTEKLFSLLNTKNKEK